MSSTWKSVIGGAFGGSATCAVLLMGGMNHSGPPAPQAPAVTVEARAFKLVDEKGVTRGNWCIREEQSIFELMDSQGRVRTTLSVGKHGELNIYRSGGKRALRLADGPDEASFLAVFDEQERLRGDFGLTSSATAIRLIDTEGVTRASAVVLGSGFAQFELTDPKQKPVWQQSNRR